MDWPQIMVVVSTVGAFIVAIGTWALVFVTRQLATGQLSLISGQLSIAKEQQKIQLYLELRRQFDGSLISARKSLARQLLDDAPHDEIKETVMDFFEDMGMLIKNDHLDRDMVWGTFSFYAGHWWRACRDYIAKERERLSDDTLFADFEYLAEKLSKQDVEHRQMSRTALEPSPADIKAFLDDEAGL